MGSPAPTDRPREKATLVIASSDTDSNLYYATEYLTSDPYVFLRIAGKAIILAGELELGRARKQARVDRVVPTLPYDTRLREQGIAPRLTDYLDLYLRERGVEELEVPPSFPVGHAERLREKGYKLTVGEEPFFPERAVKRPAEIERIVAAQRAAEEALDRAIDLLARSRIDGETLRLDGDVLTAERVQRELRMLLLERGYLAAEVIVAGGEQGCDPHVRGSGPLPPHRTIIIDIFPRSIESRYWGDLTRTVVRGRAGEAVKKIYRDVEEAKSLALSLIRDGAEGSAIHQAVVACFQARGNSTGEVNGRMQGFIHGTGHGVGLDLHEPPRISKANSTLSAGNVVTVEPGLYYPGIGAVRLEDLVVVEAAGVRNLTRFPQQLEV